MTIGNDQLVSITEFAKLRNVTTETLRHYDRINLLKPVCIKGGMRHYSILQYEKLGTIKELQQLGLTLKEIAMYFENRNVDETYKLLKEKESDLRQRIEELNSLYDKTVEKIKFLEDVRNIHFDDLAVTERHIPARRFVFMDYDIKDDVDLSFNASLLENIIPKANFLPIFATNRYAGIIDSEAIFTQNYSAKVAIQISADDDTDEILGKIIDVPAHDYICTYSRGNFFQREAALHRLYQYISEKGYRVDGKIIQLSVIDYAISDTEIAYEFQVPVHL